MRIKAVVFDLGGVLLTDPQYKEFWKNHPEADELKELFGRGKLSISEFGKRGEKMFRISKDEFLEKHKKAYTNVERMDEVINIFKKIKIAKYILSDSNPVHMPYIKKNFKDVLKLAKKAYFSPELGTKKTDLETFELLLKDIVVAPSEMVLVDNREDCLVEPKREGIRTILFKSPEQLVKDLKRLGIE